MAFLPIRAWSGRAVADRLRAWWPQILYGALLIAVFVAAGKLRFGIPQTPLMDADTWGYLNPAFSKLTGGTFQHTFGRNFVYPSFIFVVLCGWGDYEALAVVQHVLGLLSGVLLTLTWDRLAGFTKLSPRAAFGVRICGLVLVAQYLCGRPQIILEHTIRPEAVFPFFLMLSFLLNFTGLRGWLATANQRTAEWCFGGNLFVTYLGLSLKPSMGFGAVAANLPLLFWLWRGRAPRIRKAVLTGAALAVTLLMLWLPEKLLAARDRFTIFFLPTMLFTIHAPAIHAQIVDDLRTGNTAPYPRDWLSAFNQGLERSLESATQPASGPWPQLGFNADHLIYQDSIFDATFPKGERREREIADFCFHYYWRTWRARPREMLAKIGHQLSLVYGPRGSFKYKRWRLNDPYTGQLQRPMSFDYQGSSQCTENPGIYARLLGSRYGAAYVKRVHSLQRTKALFRQSLLVGYLDSTLLPLLYLPLLVVAAVSGGALLARFRQDADLLVYAVFLCILVNFGLFLTVAVAHTLEITRYVDNQRVLILLTEFAAALLPWQWWVSWRQTRVIAGPAPVSDAAV